MVRHKTTQHCSSDLDSKIKFPNTVFNYQVYIKDLENELKVKIFQFATDGLRNAPTENCPSSSICESEEAVKFVNNFLKSRQNGSIWLTCVNRCFQPIPADHEMIHLEGYNCAICHTQLTA